MLSSVVYVGSRSSLLRSLSGLIPSGDIISLKNAISLHINGSFVDSKVVLFSLPGEDVALDEYIEFIRDVDCQYLINISSIAVNAPLTLYKPLPPPKYLHTKKLAHYTTIAKGNGINLVVGILAKSFPASIFPKSTIKNIANALNDVLLDYAPLSGETKIAYQLSSGSVSFLSNTLFNIRRLLDFTPLNISLDLFYKFIRFPARGYTFYALRSVAHQICIGDGAFGCSGYERGDLVIRSDQENLVIRKLNNLLIGKTAIGLDKIRHGVEIVSHNGKILKKWNPSLRLRLPFSGRVNSTINSVSYDRKSSCFILTDEKDQSRFFSCAKLKLAAGSVQNTLFLKKLIDQSSEHEVNFDDHAIVILGRISFSELCNNDNLFSIFGIVCFRKYLYPLSYGDKVYGFAEFRPLYAGSGNKKFNLFSRILVNVSSKVFNRTGFLLFPPKFFSVHSQILVSPAYSLTLNKNSSFKSLRMHSVSDNLLQERILQSCRILNDNYSTFVSSLPVIKPSHHVYGGEVILQEPFIKQLIDNKLLSILGSPSSDKLGPYHHTLRICREIRSHYR